MGSFCLEIIYGLGGTLQMTHHLDFIASTSQKLLLRSQMAYDRTPDMTFL